MRSFSEANSFRLCGFTESTEFCMLRCKIQQKVALGYSFTFQLTFCQSRFSIIVERELVVNSCKSVFIITVYFLSK